MSRRRFLGACAAGAALPLAAPRIVLGQAGGPRRTLVVLALRGGWDSLSAVVPVEVGYYDRRPGIAVPEADLLELDRGFGLHPALAGIHGHWLAGDVAVVPATGTPTGTRSHFEETDLMELGGGSLAARPSTGWLARHLGTRPSATGPLPGVAMSYRLPLGFAGEPTAVAVPSIAGFQVGGFPGADRARVNAALAGLHDGVDPVSVQGRTALGLIDLLASSGAATLQPRNGATYGTSGTARSFAQVAQLLHAEVGVEVAVVESGGWDTHEAMGPSDDGYMQRLLRSTGDALGAFLADVSDLGDQVAVVVVSEFGRRVAENGSGGTDHGRGATMLALGRGVRGGVHGPWPGLDAGVLDRGDVPLATDYRAVLAELVDRHLGNPAVAQVFPGWSGSYVGVMP
jgi:uncharacterized protein (DUF1501 family)